MNCDPFELLEQRLGQESNYVKVQRYFNILFHLLPFPHKHIFSENYGLF